MSLSLNVLLFLSNFNFLPSLGGFCFALSKQHSVDILFIIDSFSFLYLCRILKLCIYFSRVFILLLRFY